VAPATLPEETERLLLRAPRLSDAGELLGFLGDREAMRYTYHLASLHDCRRHIAGHHCQRGRKGFGPWTVVEKASRRIVGFGGLLDDPFDPGWGIEVTYHFLPSTWGRGFATELTNHSLIVAATRLQLPEVHAFAHPDNVASRRVRAAALCRKHEPVPVRSRATGRTRLAVRPLDSAQIRRRNARRPCA
jgi:[ribosomal protein S5]-alanine N-acetyltransferase